MQKRIIISGGFDPIHDGHIDLLKSARSLGDKLFVLLNSDEWLVRKKGYCFMPWKVRRDILMEMRSVEDVISFDDSDDTAISGIKDLTNMSIFFHSYTFANGGDRGSDNTPEAQWCSDNWVNAVFGVGGDKVSSSSDFVRKIVEEGWRIRHGKL